MPVPFFLQLAVIHSRQTEAHRLLDHRAALVIGTVILPAQFGLKESAQRIISAMLPQILAAARLIPQFQLPSAALQLLLQAA